MPATKAARATRLPVHGRTTGRGAAAASLSLSTAYLWFSKHYTFDPSQALLVAAIARAYSPKRASADAKEAEAMSHDLAELRRIVDRVRKRSGWCPFPRILEALDGLEAATLRMEQAWSECGFRKLSAPKTARGKSLDDAETQTRDSAVFRWVKVISGAEPTAQLAALGAIAMGVDTPCEDAAEFAGRRKRWKMKLDRRRRAAHRNRPDS
ncbi:hypothetical protein BO221_48005 [Archangium sp. Cb G35]|uniref:hypothetical protein n=1 Tax=Archangium sp. Cb G35 TaxID=1920190 RepID=UPI0009370089|nr:hypothetical protein [Archangium sp. Cb G35]OJT16853.1 hypothetical protein BO221_48005 [Archangium sp. Cb G35]